MLMVFTFIIIILFTRENPLEINPDLFKNEICSYNGIPEISKDSKATSISCTCHKGYKTIDELDRKILSNKIYCSYQEKSRLIAFFLSITLPFGFDYLYLGRIGVFIVILLFSLVVVVGNGYIFAQAERKKNLENEIEIKPTRSLWQIGFTILALIWLVFTIINVTLMGNGVITDTNGIATADDLRNLMNDILLKE